MDNVYDTLIVNKGNSSFALSAADFFFICDDGYVSAYNLVLLIKKLP